MKKRLFAMLTCGAMALSFLAGCGSSSTDTAESAASESAEEIEEINVYIMAPGTVSDYSDVEDALNEITEAEISVHVNLNLLDSGQYFQNYSMLLSGGESVDLIQSYYDMAISANDQGAFMELTELLDTYGQDLKALLSDEDWEAAKIDGELYWIPTKHANFTSKGFMYNKEITDELGIDMTQVEDFSDWEMVMEQVQAAYPDMTMLVSPITGTMLDSMPYWDELNNGLGVIMYDDPTQVVNLYETETYRELCEIMADWYEKGYVQQDAATTSNTFPELVSTGQAFSVLSSPSVGAEESYTLQTGVELEFIYIEGPVTTTDSLLTNLWNISATSEHPEAAMKFLNLLASDVEVATLLNYGIEDVNYQVLEDGTLTYVEGESSSTAAYHPNFEVLLPNYYSLPVWSGNLEDLGDQVEALTEEAYVSPAYGFLFDSTSVTNEITACTNVVSQYAATIESGAVDVDTVLAEFIEALKDAGIDAIIEEKQAQYDEFLNSAE